MVDDPEAHNPEPISDPIPPKKKTGWPKGKKRPKRQQPRTWTPHPAQTKADLAPSDIYAGLTKSSCCDGCIPGKCVITGDEICGSPTLGLQPKHALMPEVVVRRREAKLYLAMAETEKRHAV